MSHATAANPETIDPDREPALYDYSCDVDEALGAAGELMITDAEVRAHHRAGHSGRYAAFLVCVGLSGAGKASPGSSVATWRAELDQNLASIEHAEPPTDAEIMALVASDDDLNDDLRPIANPGIAAVTITERRVKAMTSTPEKSGITQPDPMTTGTTLHWRATVKLPPFTTPVVQEFATWKQAADWARAMFDANQPPEYAAGVKQFQGLLPGHGATITGAKWTVAIDLMDQGQDGQSQDGSDGQVPGEGGEGHRPLNDPSPGHVTEDGAAGDLFASEANQDAVEPPISTKPPAGPANVVARLRTWMEGDEDGSTFDLTLTDAQAILDAIDATKPAPSAAGRKPVESTAEFIRLVLQPGGASAQELQAALGWKTPVFLSHVRQKMAGHIPQGHEVVATGTRGAQRYAVQPTA
jgi:hypothetical protein